MADLRHKDSNWSMQPDSFGNCSYDQAQLAVLMDIRDELKAMNRKLSALECPNFLAIPRVLKRISANTAKPRKAKGKPKLRVVSNS